MQRILFTALLMAYLSVSRAQTNPAMSTPVVELVVYRVKPEALDRKDLIVRQINEAVAALPGFRSRQVFQSEKDPLLLMDYVYWASAAEAHSAAEKVMALEVFGAFATLIEEIRVFEHFTIFEP